MKAEKEETKHEFGQMFEIIKFFGEQKFGQPPPQSAK